MKMKLKHMGVCKRILPGLLVIAAVGCYRVTDDGIMDRDTDTFEPSTTDSLPEGLPDSAADTDTDTDDTETVAAQDMIDEYLVHGTDSDLDTADEVDGEWDTDWYVDGQLVYIDTPHPYHPDRDGIFMVEVRELPGVFSDISVSAQFYVNPGGWTDLTGVMPLYVDEGMDSCVLVRESPIGVGGDSPMDWLDAGDVSLHTATADVSMESAYINESEGWLRYFLYDVPVTEDDRYGETFRLSATGAEIPLIPDHMLEVRTPGYHRILAPEMDSVLPREAIRILWSGGSGRKATLRGMFFHKFNVDAYGGYQMDDIHTLFCTVVDDGGFEIPADLVALVPVGYSFDGALEIRNESTIALTPEFHVQASATVRAQFRYSME